MCIINVEFYSIIILVILLINYLVKFNKSFNKASLLWLILTISTIFISISNVFFTLSDIYTIQVISSTAYFLFAIIGSLSIYVYVKYVYINSEIDFKKEFMYMIISILICTFLSIIYLFFSDSGYIIHSFDREVFNNILTLALIPNIVIFIIYFINTIKKHLKVNYLLIITLSITICGLIMDMKSDKFYLVSCAFTLTTLILYINKHEKLLNTDPLTGLSNKRRLEVYLANLRRNLTLSVYNIDIDKFKKINDKYGHLQGDIVLKDVANILRESSRDNDLIIRNGGDEFLIIAEIKNKGNAQKIIKRINDNLNKYNKQNDIKISLSIGWGIYTTSDENSLKKFTDFLNKIDMDMYDNKRKK